MVNLPSVNLAELIAVSFEPREDITAYELTILLPLILRGVCTLEEIKGIGAARKHIKTEGFQQIPSPDLLFVIQMPGLSEPEAVATGRMLNKCFRPAVLVTGG